MTDDLPTGGDFSTRKIKQMSYKNTLLFTLSLIAFYDALHAEAGTGFLEQQKAISRIAYEEGNRNKVQLIASNKWPYRQVSGVVYLDNPIAAMPGMYDYGFYHVLYCVDLLPGAGISDWLCTFNENYTRTFEGCTGTVFQIVPNGYQPMLFYVARVVAAADGIIIAKSDGNNDQNCSGASSNSNYVVLEHSDGSRTYYYDLKNGGQTQKAVGDYVNAGEFIGYPGGSSTISQLNTEHQTHLLFELRDNANNVVDPYGSQGCLGLPRYPTRWRDSTEMKEYVYKSSLLLLKTCKHKRIGIDNCGTDIKSYTLHFNPGDSIYIELGFKNYDNSLDSFLLNIINPVGVPIINTIVRNRGCPTCSIYSFLDLLQGVKLPTGALMIPGTYTIAVNYYSFTYGSYDYLHYITVGCQADYTLPFTENGESGTIAGNNIYSTQICNPGSRVKLIAGNQIILSPGFHAKSGSNVMIFNDACIVPGFQRTE